MSNQLSKRVLKRISWTLLAIAACLGLRQDACVAGSVEFGPATNFPAGNYPRAVVVADFNRDGTPDVFVVGNGSGLSLLLGLGNGVLGAPTKYAIAAYAVATGDFNNDGKLDLVAAGSYNTRILLGDGTGNLSVFTNLNNPPSYPSAVAIADFNSDGKVDLAMTYSYGCTVAYGQGDGSFGSRTNYAFANDPGDICVGDLNGDGRLDLAVSLSNYTSGTSNSVCVLTNNGNGAFGAPHYYTGDRGTTGVFHPALTLGDFNGDEKLDIAVLDSNPSNFDSNSVTIWLNNGSGMFLAVNRYSLGFSPNSIASADFNGDGKIDLVARGETAARVLCGHGDGSFTVNAQMSVPSDSAIGRGSVAVGDFNGDGMPDLVLTSYPDNSVAIMLNQTPPTLEITPMASYNQLTWPATFGAGFTLECTTNLLAPDSWHPFPYPPVLIGNLKAVADWTDREQKFYRLQKPRSP